MSRPSTKASEIATELSPRARDAEIAAIADAQHGVISISQLRDVGLGQSGVRDRVAAGKLHRVYRGAYAVGHSRVTWKGRYMAAVLACGEEAVLSHRSSARLHGLRRTAGRVDVTVPARPPRVQGIDGHRTRILDPLDRTVVDAVRCTSVARTIFDLADAEGDERATQKDMARAEELRTFDLGAVQRVLAQATGRRGARVVARVLGIPGIRTRSDLEELFFAICDRAGLPRPLVNMPIVLGGTHFEADFAWPELMLIVETDGWATHGTRSAFASDRRRDRKLAAAGWRVLRFTWYEIEHEPEKVAEELAVHLALAS